MSGAMAPLKDLQVFKDYMIELSKNPVLGVFVGTGLTLLIQASSATIGILQNLYAGNLIDLQGALPVLFGDNIGTTITAIIASLGANIAAKRVAGAHVAFNVIGTVVCVIFLVPFTVLIHWFEATLNLAPEMTIAFAHGTLILPTPLSNFHLSELWLTL